MKIIICTLSLLAIFTLTACGPIAVWTAPSRIAESATDNVSKAAQDAFLETLDQGQYDQLGVVTEQLTKVYLDHPNNSRTNLYLGMAHLWAVAERERLNPIPARITESLTLADFYLGEAVKLTPDDSRIAGFQAAARMAMGSVHQIERWKRLGYFQAKDAVSDYPEFNLFVLSSAMVQLPPQDPGLDEAEDALWRTAEVCFDHSIDPMHFNPKLMHEEIISAQKNFSGSRRERACFNSTLAPHNIEGFFLHFGDVLAKNGKESDARSIYQLASASVTYSTWPFRHVIKSRITTLNKTIERFSTASRVVDEPEIMARASYACVACHQT